jgi:hypothetical protein
VYMLPHNDIWLMMGVHLGTARTGTHQTTWLPVQHLLRGSPMFWQLQGLFAWSLLRIVHDRLLLHVVCAWVETGRELGSNRHNCDCLHSG